MEYLFLALSIVLSAAGTVGLSEYGEIAPYVNIQKRPDKIERPEYTILSINEIELISDENDLFNSTIQVKIDEKTYSSKIYDCSLSLDNKIIIYKSGEAHIHLQEKILDEINQYIWCNTEEPHNKKYEL